MRTYNSGYTKQEHVRDLVSAIVVSGTILAVLTLLVMV